MRRRARWWLGCLAVVVGVLAGDLPAVSAAVVSVERQEAPTPAQIDPADLPAVPSEAAAPAVVEVPSGDFTDAPPTAGETRAAPSRFDRDAAVPVEEVVVGAGR